MTDADVTHCLVVLSWETNCSETRGKCVFDTQCFSWASSAFSVFEGYDVCGHSHTSGTKWMTWASVIFCHTWSEWEQRPGCSCRVHTTWHKMAKCYWTCNFSLTYYVCMYNNNNICFIHPSRKLSLSFNIIRLNQNWILWLIMCVCITIYALFIPAGN